VGGWGSAVEKAQIWDQAVGVITRAVVSDECASVSCEVDIAAWKLPSFRSGRMKWYTLLPSLVWSRRSLRWVGLLYTHIEDCRGWRQEAMMG
jgi:hypothetical protein